MSKKFWKWSGAVESNDSELILDGPISELSWWGDEVTPKDFRDELKKHKGSLVVVMNSGGGDVFAGISIYNALREFEHDVTVRVDGLSASIASVIAMAADKVIMSPGSMMMIHKPWTMAVGDANELDKVKEVLNGIENSIIPIYQNRTGKNTDEIRELLEAETWMTAEQAVEMGFADELIEAKKSSFSDAIKNAFNGQFAFNMSATQRSLDDFVAKVKAETPEEVEETDVTDKTPETTDEVVQPKADDGEITAPPVEEPKEPTNQTNAVEKEIEMKTEEIAKDQVMAPQSQAPVEAKPVMKDYLKSKESMEAFARVLEEQAGKTSDDVKAAWKNHLEVKLGVTNPEIFLPTALISEIEDAFKAGGEIWNRVIKTGADVFRAAWDSEDDPSSEDGRARGYNRADQEEKAEQVLTIADRVLRPQFVYKYITLNKEDVKNQRSTGALVRYVLSELPRRIIRELERAIVIGDGRAPGSDYKISSFVAITTDAAANNVFAEEYTPGVGESHYESVLRASDQLEADGPVVLISRKGYMTDMYLERNENGGLVFNPGTNLRQVLSLDTNLTPDWFEEQDDYDAILVVLSGYKTVGDASIESFTNFILKTNKQEYLQEVWAGGGLTMRKAAVAIVAATS
jgi:ATP-dependent Clp protease protease subunit